MSGGEFFKNLFKEKRHPSRGQPQPEPQPHTSTKPLLHSAKKIHEIKMSSQKVASMSFSCQISNEEDWKKAMETKMIRNEIF